ncbi:FERM domain-containing protein 5-like isoform X2 [Limulus polyphemus]|uniref:Moesin/ezrin/radixin homolog 1 n=1 Tax=Limulus polyphemus TaxID=6850 RepID=A0ABM1BUQ0_LIMPO|nr:FERM domain-containing protein 5-like isoform X2 [Limulus polyphemus]
MMLRIGSKKDMNREYSCTIRLIDDNEVIECAFRRDHKGQYLLDYVCSTLNLVEKDYFGLRYVDLSRQRHWLDTGRSILKQVKGLQTIIFFFRVKFYPPEPHQLKEEITRYQIFLQLRRDLLHGRLYSSQDDSAQLAGYIVQSELGDYDPDEHSGNYVADFKLLLKQTARLEEKVAEIHQCHLRGQVPAVAEINFLQKACVLDAYGVDPHPVKDPKGNQMYLGINHAGISTFVGSQKTHHFKWQDIQRINFEGKMFIIHLLLNERKHLIGFKCPTQAACKHLWKCALEQRYFFMVKSSAEVPAVTTGGGLFSRGSKFRYSGRVEKEVVELMKNLQRDPPQFQRSMRSSSFHQQSESYPTTPATLCAEYETDFSDIHYLNNSAPLTENMDSFTSTDSSSYKCINHSTQNTESLSGLTLPEHEEAPIPLLEEPENQRIEQLEDKISEESQNLNEDNQQDELEITFPSCQTSTSQTGEKLEQKPHNEYVEEVYALSKTQQAEKSIQQDLIIPQQTKCQSNQQFLSHSVNVVRVTILAFLFIILLLWCLLIVVMESDSAIFSEVRMLPALVMLRREYYEPAKDFIIYCLMFLF